MQPMPEMELQAADPNDHPQVRVRPPLLYLGFLGGAILLDLIFPVNVFSWGFQFAVGMLVICAGAGLLTYCFMRFTRAGTNVPTSKPTTTLVTDGPYAFTRNPIYFGLTLTYAGCCILFDLLWGFPLVVPLIYIMNTYVIEHEEEYLMKKFGEPYLEYQDKVNRWL